MVGPPISDVTLTSRSLATNSGPQDQNCEKRVEDQRRRRQGFGKDSSSATRESLGVTTATDTQGAVHMIDRIRALAIAATGAVLLLSGLGLVAVGLSGMA
jgi:hypothetical protein